MQQQKKKVHFFSLLLIVYSSYVLAIDRAMVVITPSYNNAQWYEGNLHSVFAQDYTNYRVIYIDDCSTDGTYQLVETYVKKCGQQHRVHLVGNSVRRRALANLYDAIMSCAADEIVVILDGDDRFAHTRVLKIINEAYQDGNTWLTYGQFMLWPSNQIGWGANYPADIVRNNAFRDYAHTPSHLRTFYAGLFKHIQKEDLMYEGDFFVMTYDMAMMLPMIEMARDHFKFIPQVLYIYNEGSPINDHKINKQLQRQLDLVIRSRRRYEKVVSPF